VAGVARWKRKQLS